MSKILTGAAMLAVAAGVAVAVAGPAHAEPQQSTPSTRYGYITPTDDQSAQTRYGYVTPGDDHTAQTRYGY